MNRVSAYLRDNVLGLVAIFIALSGTAYAASTINSRDVENDSLKSVDLKDGAAVGSADVIDGSVSTPDLEDNGIRAADIRDDNLQGGGLGASDLGTGSVGTAEIANGSITGADISDPQYDQYGDYTRGGITSADVQNHWPDYYGFPTGGLQEEDLGANSVGDVQFDDENIHGVPVGYREVFQNTVNSVPRNQYTNVDVDCPYRYGYKTRPLGGGFSTNYPMRLVASHPLDEDTWHVTVYNDITDSGATVTAWVVCARSDSVPAYESPFKRRMALSGATERKDP